MNGSDWCALVIGLLILTCLVLSFRASWAKADLEDAMLVKIERERIEKYNHAQRSRDRAWERVLSARKEKAAESEKVWMEEFVECAWQVRQYQ